MALVLSLPVGQSVALGDDMTATFVDRELSGCRLSIVTAVYSLDVVLSLHNSISWGEVSLQLVKMSGCQIGLAIEAPRHVRVWRIKPGDAQPGEAAKAA